MKGVGAFLGFGVWVAGVILAKGCWVTLAAIFIPFVAWFITIGKVLSIAGWV